MKKFLSLLLFALCLSARGQQVITATVTVTNLPTNGFTISVNGNVRTWTNTVTSANNQIANTNSLGAATTNLFYSYILSPQPSMTVSISGVSSNTLLFQAYPSAANTVTFGSNWARVSYSTNTLTPMQMFRGFASQVGNYERTNTANGIVSYLSSDAVTNAIPTNAPAFVNFIPPSLVGISNLVLTLSTNSTNFTLATSNAMYTFIVNATNGIGGSAYHGTSYYELASTNLDGWATITTNSILSLLNGTSYLDGSGNIKLIDGNTITRLEADKGGQFYLSYASGTHFFSTDANNSYYFWDASTAVRIAIYDAAVNNGSCVFAPSDGHAALTLDGINDHVETYSVVSMNRNLLPAMAIGTVTNFIADEQNSGNSETTVDSYTIPANVLIHDGDTFTRVIGVKTAANANSKTVKVYFDGNLAGSAVTSDSGAFFYLTVEITRDSSTSYRSMYGGSTGSGTGGGTAGSAFAYVNAVSGEDWTTTKVFKVTLTGTSTGDLTSTLDRISFSPSAQDSY